MPCFALHYLASPQVRGGSASADLTHLADYDLARAIYLMPVPMLVGIGHQVNWTLLDEVAHLSLPTPSAVAGHIMKTVSGNCAATEQAILSIRHRVGSDAARLERATADCVAKAREGARPAVDQAEIGARMVSRSLELNTRTLLDLASGYAQEAGDAAGSAVPSALSGVTAGGRALLKQDEQDLASASATIRSTSATLLYQATISLSAAK